MQNNVTPCKVEVRLVKYQAVMWSIMLISCKRGYNMQPTLEVFGSQIVLLGSFNPPIFSPDWLNRNGLIGDDDMADAKASESFVMTPEVTRFETESFSLQVVSGQFALNSKGPVTPQIRDLATGIFTLVDQTPITALGLNFHADFKMPTIEQWHKVGDFLAPKSIWKKFFPDTSSVGMNQIVMEIDPFQRGADEVALRRQRMTVSYSKSIPIGVNFFYNDHFVVESEAKSRVSTASIAVSKIGTHWDEVMNTSTKIFTGMLSEISSGEAS